MEMAQDDDPGLTLARGPSSLSGHTMVIQEIDNRSLTSRAVELLRADIIGASLRPNERLRIQALSERYGVGATAIREALSRLVSDWLVVFEDQRGFCVAPMSRAELLEMNRTRIDVESLAIRYAVEEGDIQWESGLISAFHRLSHPPTLRSRPATQLGRSPPAVPCGPHRGLRLSLVDPPVRAAVRPV